MLAPMHDYDYFVIGAGSGGVRSARIAASLGARVAICEDQRLGGTCVNVGCVPKKLLVYASQFNGAFRDAAGYGWSVGERHLDWATTVRNITGEVTRLNGIYGRILGNAGVELIRGRGRITGPHTVEVDGRAYTAGKILVATGSRPFVPEIPGHEHAVVSDAMFTLPELPARITVIGGGYIGLEFAGICRAMGSEVSVVYRADLPLRGFDHGVRTFLAEELVKRGLTLHPSSRIEEITAERTVRLADGTAIESDLVLLATGRVPNTEGLGLDAVGVRTTDRGAVIVDNHYATHVPSIFAVGDVIDHIQLTPVALNEGMALARRLFGGPETTINYALIPSAVFSQPTIGTVGLSEEDAVKDHDIVVFESRFRPMKNIVAGSDHRMMMKIIVDKPTDRVLGMHVVGPDAGEIVQGFAAAMTAGVTKAQLDSTIGIHPTAAEELVTMRTPRAD